ncbi:hypothetical protein CYMTET_26887 [Cymbomonas tetramitiformis]|uniref:Uncharacterized protein n=1 Tax=Cymbomonas tetramitiformis TaxID=36881 RepID=A0AAE0KXP7_9CHLO|nr:hypothetical protein CYMTET_26887 [Cymbomonas tetramitiformis]
MNTSSAVTAVPTATPTLQTFTLEECLANCPENIDSTSNIDSQDLLKDASVDWEDIGTQLVWSVVFQVLILLTSKLFQRLYSQEDVSIILAFRKWIQSTLTSTGDSKKLYCAWLWMDLMCSAVTVLLWYAKTYEQDVAGWMQTVESITSTFFLFNYCQNMFAHEFSPGYVMGVDALVDAITIPPLILQNWSPEVWLSFSYARSWSAVSAYLRIDSTGVLANWFSDMTQGYIIALIEFVAFVSCLSSTILVFEVLGDFSWLQDEFHLTTMGPISGYQMFYWMVTTVSTVGYGDYAPTTVLSRGCICIFIPLGVIFFTVITGQVVELQETAASGRGRLHLKRGASPHAILAGGAVTSVSTVTVRSFLEEILHRDRPVRPHVVIFSSDPINDGMRNLLKEPWLKGHVTWLRGHPVNPQDLARCQIQAVEMVFILGDLFSQAMDKEDQANSMLASVFLKYNPEMKMRLMLLRPASRQMALNLGVSLDRCVAINELKASIVARSCMCPGFSTFLTNLFRLEYDDDGCKSENEKKSLIPPWSREGMDSAEWLKHPIFQADWVDEFMHGSENDLYGVQLHPKFHGMNFCEVALRLVRDHAIFLLAAQVEGRLVIHPGRSAVLTAKTVVFVAAENLRATNAIQPPGFREGDWRKVFSEQRKSKKRVLTKKQGPPGATALLKSQAFLGSSKEKKPSLLAPVVTKAAKPNKVGMPWQPMVGKAGGGKAAVFGLIPQEPKIADDGGTLASDDNNGEVQLELLKQNKKGEFFVIIAQDGSLWQQVTRIIAPLLEARSEARIIVLAAAACPENTKQQFKQVAFIHADIHCMDTLRACGVKFAKMVMVLSSQPTTLTDADLDRTNLITVTLIEKLFEGLSVAPFVLLDIHSPQNVRQLFNDCPKVIPPSALGKDDPSPQDSLQSGKRTSSAHPRYCGGRIVSRSHLVKFFATAFYTPGCLELAEALAVPEATGQTSSTLLVPALHEFWGRRFMDVYEEIISKFDLIMIGLSRTPSDPMNTIPFVYAFPPRDAVIIPSDQLYLIGTTAAVEGILRSAGKPVLKFTAAYGFRNIQILLRKIKLKKSEYRFVEIMACPSGCLNGAGQSKGSGDTPEEAKQTVSRGRGGGLLSFRGSIQDARRQSDCAKNIFRMAGWSIIGNGKRNAACTISPKRKYGRSLHKQLVITCVLFGK